jgi:hypothetical protein
MTKARQSNKETKKHANLNFKEKRAAKKIKKDAKEITPTFLPH